MKPLAGQVLAFLRAASEWTAFRLAVFVVLAVVAGRIPNAYAGPVWVGVLVAGVWAFLALGRSAARVADRWIPVGRRRWAELGKWTLRWQPLWRLGGTLCVVVLLGVTLFRAWPSWSLLATTSLREDEILNIERYTSEGFVPAVSSYHLARNHVFFNILNGLLPGGASMHPLRARIVSFAAVLGGLAVLVAYAFRRGWLLAGLAGAGLVAVNYFTLQVLLEARGYGLIFFLAMAQLAAITEWLRTRRNAWLTTAAVACALGAYTLPFYIAFGGPILLAAFFWRPGKKTLLAGLLTLAALAMMYFPIAGDVLRVFTAYGGENDDVTNDFSSIRAVFQTLQYFVPFELLRVDLLAMTLVALGAVVFASMARCVARTDRVAFGVTAAAFLAFLAFSFAVQTVPIRVSAFLAAPLAFATVVAVGSSLAAQAVAPVRPVALLAFAALAAGLIWRSEPGEDLIPRQNWRGLATAIERIFSPQTPIWVGGKYGRLLAWHLQDRERVHGGKLDSAAVRAGRLVAVEGFFKMSDEEKRLRRDDLPDDVRFVTSPLSINYHRIFFLPPTHRGITAVTGNGAPLTLPVPGAQQADPMLLEGHYTHGDAWQNQYAGTPPPATPTPLGLPATIEVAVDPGAPAGTCNFLFSQSMEGRLLEAQVCDRYGRWRGVGGIFVMGELVSVRLDKPDRTRVRLTVRTPEPASAAAEITPPPARPNFGLLDAWILPRDPR